MRCASMTRVGARGAGEDCREFAGPGKEESGADGEDAGVYGMQLVPLEPSPNFLCSEGGGQELLPGHEPPLPLGDSGDDLVSMWRFRPHEGYKSPLDGARPNRP